MDLIYLACIVAFWALCVAFATGCEKLGSRAPGGRP
jgi:hypothetical protein